MNTTLHGNSFYHLAANGFGGERKGDRICILVIKGPAVSPDASLDVQSLIQVAYHIRRQYDKIFTSNIPKETDKAIFL